MLYKNRDKQKYHIDLLSIGRLYALDLNRRLVLIVLWLVNGRLYALDVNQIIHVN